MASGSTGRGNNPTSKGFNFGSDDILCSYEDYGHQDGSNGTGHSEPPVNGSNSTTNEFHKSRTARTSAFPSASYNPPEESSFNQDLLSTVEMTMKKYTDNLMRFLEGISSRMSQLELYCYNLDKTIGEMRSEMVHDHGEADSKLKSLDKHVQEVHRSIQILRDKQELAETQKELAKFHVVQKETSTTGSPQQNQDRSTVASADTKASETSSDNQLALALPNQIPPQAAVPNHPGEQKQQPPIAPAQQMPVSQAYYLTQAQLPNISAPAQISQGQYLPADSQFRAPQMQNLSRLPQQPAQPQLNQSTQVQLLSPYQAQWVHQYPQQVQQGQQAAMQPQMRPPSSPVYSSYLPNQANPTPEGVPNSMPMQLQFSGTSQSSGTRPEAVPYGYGAAGRPVQPQPQTQHLKPNYGSAGDGYAPTGPHTTLTPGNTYIMYGEGGSSAHHPAQPPHFSQSSYPPSNMPSQNFQPPSNLPSQNFQPPTGPNPHTRPPSSYRSSPYGELIEKLLSMGYRGEHVVGAIQRLEESGQPVEFNTVLDTLNGHSSGSSQRGWSG